MATRNPARKPVDVVVFLIIYMVSYVSGPINSSDYIRKYE